MTLALPEDINNPSPSSIVGDGIRKIKREIRSFYKEPVPDRIVLSPASRTLSSGDNLDVDIEVYTDLGTQAVIELLDVELNVKDSKTANSNTTVTFSNVASDVHWLQGYIEDGSNRLVSERFFEKIIVDSEPLYPTLASHYEVLSERDRTKKSEELRVKRQDDLNNASNPVFTIYQNKDAECDKVERHVDLIAGLRDGYNGNDPLQDSDVTNGASAGTTRLFPQGYSGAQPKQENWVVGPPNFDESADSILFYSSPNGSRTPGVNSEKTDLQNASAPATIYDETREKDVTYNSSSEIQERIDEINDLITGGTLDASERSVNALANDTDGFNSHTTVNNLFDDRYTWVDLYTNHSNGFKYLYNELDLTDDFGNDKETMVDNIVNDIGA